MIDPWSPFHGCARQILAAGGSIHRQAEVIGGQFDGLHWQVETNTGAFIATSVVNCAGLYGDRIDALFQGRTDFTIKPRKRCSWFLTRPPPGFCAPSSCRFPMPAPKRSPDARHLRQPACLSYSPIFGRISG